MDKKLFFKRFYPESMILRRAICSAIAMFVAVLTDHYYSMLHQFWVGLTTVLVLQMTARTNFRQEARRFLVIIGSVIFGTLLVMYVHPPVVVNSIIVAVFVVGCFLHRYYSSKSNGFTPALMIAIVTLMMLVPFTQTGDVLFARLHDVVLGGFIGVIAALIIFPARPDIDFRTSLVPVLNSYSDYLAAIAQLFFQEKDAAENADDKKAEMEKALQNRQAFFPDWVYETGFTANLREGHRHFLWRIEQLGEILFAMHYHARYPVDSSMLDEVREPVRRCIDDAKSLIEDLRVVLEKADLKSTYYDFVGDVTELENIFNTKIAMPFELADASKDYMHVAGFIYDIKDLQQVLSKLEESLRGYISRINLESI